MSTLGKGLTGGLMALLCLLNVIAISIIVVQNKGADTTGTSIQMSEAGIGITLTVTALYAIYAFYKFKNPRPTDSVVYFLVVGIVMTLLCLLNVIALSIVMMEAESATSFTVDSTAYQMALAGISITIIVTFVYMIYCFATMGGSKSSVQKSVN